MEPIPEGRTEVDDPDMDARPTPSRGPTKSAEGTRDLEHRIQELEDELAQMRSLNALFDSVKKPQTFQVFNTLDMDETVYLAEPTWSVEDGIQYLKGNLPVPDELDHLRQRGNIAFVVFRNFSNEFMAKDLAKIDNLHTLPNTRPANQYIKLFSKPMTQAWKAFKEANKEFSSISDRLLLDSPFPFWYHFRSTAGVDGLVPEQRQLIELLTGWIDKEYGKDYAEAEALFSQGLVTRTMLPYLIAPGEVAVSNAEKAHLSSGLMATEWLQRHPDDEEVPAEYGQTRCEYWTLRAWSYSFNGRFQKKKVALVIEFKTTSEEERVPMRSLTAYPLRYASEEIKSRLRRRGETAWECRVRKLVSYQYGDENDVLASRDERFMVDVSTYRMLHTDAPGLKGPGEDEEEEEYMLEEISAAGHPPKGHEALFPLTILGFSLRRKKWSKSRHAEQGKEPLNADNSLLLTVTLEVDRIRDVTWYRNAFDHLVIDEDTKELVHALITNRIEAENNTDWINAKGNGLIILLHGGPGTGKTFTAESVAELAKKPLYPVTCGDIGTKPEEVEKYLQSVFHLGKLWDCVVLLDEADVFLEQRTLNDLKRNALVSVFLRVLEYYEGVLILTSNRVGIFDEAFKSRIQLALRYENLDRGQRTQVWKNFFRRLESLGEEGIEYDTLESYVEELAEYEMNGRQIRNAITTARQLAKFKGKAMNFGHLRHVIKVSGKFDKYLLDVRGDIKDDDIARGEGIR